MRKLSIPALLVRLISALTLSVLGGCGIDSGGAQAPAPAASSSSALLVVGPITGFGSVHVNGLTLQTAAADIRVDGNPVAESALREGQIIRAVAAVTSSSIDAVEIEYQANIRGPVDALGLGGRLVILGQAVDTDARTVFGTDGGSSLADLGSPARVEVSGFRLPSGVLQATYVGIADPTAPLTVTSAISSVDANALTFELGGLTVDYSQVLILDVPTGIPDVGLVVAVEGTDRAAGGELIVTRIRSLDAAPGTLVASDIGETSFAAVGTDASAVRRANITSVITAVLPSAAALPSSITIGDVTVSIDALTRISGGSVDELVPGRLVQVEGVVASVGLIQATRIELL